MDLQALFPVYLPKTRTDDQTKEDYETAIAQNENNVNQNFAILFNAVRDLADDAAVQSENITTVQTIIQSSDNKGGSGDYDLPIASDKKLGGVMVGENLAISDTGVLSVTTADDVEEDNTKPITSAAVHVEIGNINVLLASI